MVAPENGYGGGVQSIPDVNPEEVDRMLANELNELSLYDRELVMEEVHGINRASERQQGAFEGALVAMQEELDKHYLGNESSASINQSIPTPGMEKIEGDTQVVDSGSSSSLTFRAYREARSRNSHLLSDYLFRRAFLIAESNDPKKAAIRLMKYLDLIHDLFETSHVLFRPIFLDDLHPEAKQELMMGSYQILPERDSSGRRVFCYLRDASSPKEWTPRKQLYLYFRQRLYEEETGMVAVVFLHNSTVFTNKNDMMSFDYGLKFVPYLPSRFSAIHLCLSNHPMCNVVRSAMMLIMGKEARSRVRLHIGSLTECQYSLRPFGIPVDRLPSALEFNTTHRKDNIANHTKWLRIQRAKEMTIEKIMVGDRIGDEKELTAREMDGKNTNSEVVHKLDGMEAVHLFRSKFVEYPRHEDCLFGRGRNTMKHPGNVAMRRLLEEKQGRYSAALHYTKAEIAWEVVNTIKDGGGRFLKESNIGLYTLVDDETARKKISIAFRDLKSKSQAKRAQQVQQASNQEIGPMSVQMGMQEFAKRQKFSDIEDCVPNMKECF
eukprot:CAMPEP_0172370992 /NCGR_PEP_ID=MMETSP1060-20121228/40774_1 /TAXON_ID=37318 /ORGANISM="Pseudo-nitzschia pungens, Strain cf. cingulata" /LENGTH=549 /DNA_ID=CAMNT_0013096479 /DNA_START=90 /DNA_END=1739 /DNA_ORIENTATION=+